MKTGKAWFGPRRLGAFSATASWQGWVAILIFLAGLVALQHYLGRSGLDLHFPWPGLVKLAWLFAFFVVWRLTYDPDAR